jgi:cytochrome subunit of sulfide dehydrogenase
MALMLARTFNLRPGKTCERGKPIAQAIANGARRVIALLMATSPFVFVVHPGAVAESNRGAQLAAMCASCHRLDGRDRGIPSIVGLDKRKLVDTMEDFKSGKRSSQIMQVVARSLSTEEIAVLADYLAARQKGSQQP